MQHRSCWPVPIRRVPCFLHGFLGFSCDELQGSRVQDPGGTLKGTALCILPEQPHLSMHSPFPWSLHHGAALRAGGSRMNPPFPAGAWRGGSWALGPLSEVPDEPAPWFWGARVRTGASVQVLTARELQRQLHSPEGWSAGEVGQEGNKCTAQLCQHSSKENMDDERHRSPWCMQGPFQFILENQDS